MKTIIKSQLKRLISGFSYGLYIVLGMFFTGSIVLWAASLTATSGAPLTATNWNDMVSNFFWGSGTTGIYYNGNVGIGTIDPNITGVNGGKLRIYSNDNTHPGLSVETTSTSYVAGYFNGAKRGLRVDVADNTSNYWAFRVANSGGELFKIRNDGNVGIGNANPTEKLEVSGTIKASSLSATTGGFFRMHLNSCSGPCAGNDTLGTWTSKGGLNWDTAYNTNSALFTKDSKGVVTVNQAGTYLVTLTHMVVPIADSQRGGAGYFCPYLNGSATCHYGGTDSLHFRYSKAGYWDNGKHDFVMQLAAGSTLARGYSPLQVMTYWGHDGYVSLEITRIN